MGKILRGPFDIRLDGVQLADVEFIQYHNKRLTIRFWPTNYEQATEIANGKYISKVQFLSCGSDKVGVEYSVLNTRAAEHQQFIKVKKPSLNLVYMEIVLQISDVKIGSLE